LSQPQLKFDARKFLEMNNINLVSVRIITAEIRRLVQSFENATDITIKWFT
jgi:hypothetical protein